MSVTIENVIHTFFSAYSLPSDFLETLKTSENAPDPKHVTKFNVGRAGVRTNLRDDVKIVDVGLRHASMSQL
jgi:hypothetical protein